MNNSFSSFIETYSDDIVAFVKALKELLTSLIGKLFADDNAEA